jgi:hypothetical protein
MMKPRASIPLPCRFHSAQGCTRVHGAAKGADCREGGVQKMIPGGRTWIGRINPEIVLELMLTMRFYSVERALGLAAGTTLTNHGAARNNRKT